MSTGYSRVAEGRKPADWHGWKADVEQFTEFIRLWCTREDRWMSPKFIIGESYGTVRGVSVAQKLQDDYGLYLNGILLLSSVLDFGSQDFENLRWDRSCIHFLPSYAAIAWYHGKHPGRSLDEVLAEAETFADGPYDLPWPRAGDWTPKSAPKWSRRWRGSPDCRSAMSSSPACASSMNVSAPNCCAMRAWWWAESMADSPGRPRPAPKS